MRDDKSGRTNQTNQDDDKSGPDQSDPKAKANVRTGHWGLLRIESSVGCVSSLVCHRSRLRRAEQTEEAAEPEEYPEEETWSA
jgi:hypothetical protein